MKKLLTSICLILALAGCKSNVKSEGSSSDMSSSSLDIESSTSYADGEYCASIEYYNGDTGTSSSYTLTVHIEDGLLTQIDWPNGGYLDSSHFSPADVDEDGSCSFSTYDGKDYTVQIDEDGECSGNYGSPEEDDSEEQRIKDEEEKRRQRDKEVVESREEERIEDEKQEESERQRRLEDERRLEEEESNNEEGLTALPSDWLIKSKR